MMPILPFFSTTTKRLTSQLRRAETPLRNNPLIGMGVLLLVLLLIILVSSSQRRPQLTEEAASVQAKEVPIFYVGELPSIRTSAQVSQTGVIQIVAQSAGIVQEIQTESGKDVRQGQAIVRLSTSYSGGSVPAVQRQLASLEYENAKNNRELQLQIIDLERKNATASAQSEQDQRKLQVAALADTRSLLDLTDLQLKVVDDALATATASADIQTLRQQKSQLLSSALQLRSSIRSLEYTEKSDTPLAERTVFTRELTLRQLELKERALYVQEDAARLQAKIARIQESLLYPAAPFAGTIERIHVEKGQAVTPGQVIATLNCDQLATRVTALVTPQIARQISALEPATIQLSDREVRLYPDYISSVATDGTLHSVLFTLPSDAFYAVTNQAFVSVTLPLAAQNTQAAVPYIPLDAIYQTEKQTIVLVMNDAGIAESRAVTLGTVSGRFVAVTGGLEENARIITDRTIVAGDQVVSISAATEE